MNHRKWDFFSTWLRDFSKRSDTSSHCPIQLAEIQRSPPEIYETKIVSEPKWLKPLQFCWLLFTEDILHLWCMKPYTKWDKYHRLNWFSRRISPINSFTSSSTFGLLGFRTKGRARSRCQAGIVPPEGKLWWKRMPWGLLETYIYILKKTHVPKIVAKSLKLANCRIWDSWACWMSNIFKYVWDSLFQSNLSIRFVQSIPMFNSRRYVEMSLGP